MGVKEAVEALEFGANYGAISSLFRTRPSDRFGWVWSVRVCSHGESKSRMNASAAPLETASSCICPFFNSLSTRSNFEADLLSPDVAAQASSKRAKFRKPQ
jgi:hypothetical protein